MDVGPFMICSFGTVLLLGDHNYYLRLCQLSKVHYWPSVTILLTVQNKKTVIEKAFHWLTDGSPTSANISVSRGSCVLFFNGRCLLFFIFPDECLFLRNKRDNEGFVMENDEIRLKRRRAMEDPLAFRSTGTSSWYAPNHNPSVKQL